MEEIKMAEENGIRNLRIVNESIVDYTPEQLVTEIHPASDEVKAHVMRSRETIQNILDDKDSRRLITMGQCSVNDPDADRELSGEIAGLAEEVRPKIVIVKRVYFEKPRSGIGWKGLIYDPGIDASFDVNRGLSLARRILLATNELGLPTATEFLGPDIPQYIGDLVSYGAIGARTTYSQTHRELASGLSMPVGMKNGTDGNLANSVDSVYAVSLPGVFFGENAETGRDALFETRGHPGAHLILRGGNGAPNYDANSVETALKLLEKRGLPRRLVIDCSHDNTIYKGKKDYERQAVVFEDVRRQMSDNPAIKGIMLEVNLVAGQQKIPSTIEEMRSFDKTTLVRGQSITDGCINLDTARYLVRGLYRDMTTSTFATGR